MNHGFPGVRSTSFDHKLLCENQQDLFTTFLNYFPTHEPKHIDLSCCLLLTRGRNINPKWKFQSFDLFSPLPAFFLNINGIVAIKINKKEAEEHKNIKILDSLTL